MNGEVFTHILLLSLSSCQGQVTAVSAIWKQYKSPLKYPGTVVRHGGCFRGRRTVQAHDINADKALRKVPAKL